MTKKIKQRLEYLRGELRGERISMQELVELEALAEHIAPDDVELLQAACVPEGWIVQTFRIFRRSENRNNFGHRKYYLLNRDGVAFTACRVYDLPVNAEFTLYKNKTSDAWTGWAELGFEVPTRLEPNAPAKVVKEVFKPERVKADFHACVMG